MTVWLLFIALLATSIGQSVVMTLLPPLGREVGISELQVAAILSTSALIFALGTTVWGHASQRFGRKRILLVGLGGYTLGTLLFGSVFYTGLHGLLAGTPLFIALLVSRSLQSTIMSATPPTALGIAIASSPGGSRLGAISRVTSANSLGQVLGPALGGMLAGFGLLVPLYTIAALTCVALVLVALKLPSDAPTAQPQQAPTASTHGSGSGNDSANHNSNSDASISNGSGLRYVLIAAGLFCAMAMLHQTLGFFFMDELGMTPVQAAQRVGVAAMIIALVSLVVQFGFVQRTDWGHARLLMLGLGLLLCGYTTLALFHHLAGTYAAMVLLGMGMGCSYPATTAAATASGNPRQQARATGLISAAPAMGFVIGPPLAALLYHVNAVGPFAAAIVLMLAMLMLHRWPLSGTDKD